MPILDIKKWQFGWPNQNSRATFIVQTFAKYGLKDVDLMNLSFLTPFWPNFNFVDFRAFFGNFSRVKNAKNKSAIPLMIRIRIRIRALSKTIYLGQTFFPWLSYV